jgi:peptidoglycan DL-endopeptidase LytF
MQLSTAGTHPDVPGQKNAYESVVAISRRDTVIIAMLVNIALLFVLFASATKNYDDLEKGVAAAPAAVEKTALKQVENTLADTPQPLSVKNQANSPPVDEIDEILQQYALKQQQIQSQIVQAKELAPPKALPVIKKAKEVLPETNSFIEVKVKKGDSLAKIAKAHGVTIEQIMACSALVNAKLQIGQMLKIPPADKTAKKSQEVAKAAIQEDIVKESEAQYYIVKSGDNPWTVARKFHLKFEDLLKLNDLNEEKARNLKIGQKIRIR